MQIMSHMQCQDLFSLNNKFGMTAATNFAWHFKDEFNLYLDIGRVIMKGSVQWSAVSHELNSISSGIQTWDVLIWSWEH